MYIDAIDDMDVWSDFATKECSWNGRNVKPLYMREQDASIVNAVFSWDDRMTATPAMSRPSQTIQDSMGRDGELVERQTTIEYGVSLGIIEGKISVTDTHRFPPSEKPPENRETDVQERDRK